MNIQINPGAYQTDRAGMSSNVGELIESQIINVEKHNQLSVGEILSGRITEMNNNNLMLLLEDGTTLSAKMNGDMNVGVGQTLSFEVKATQGNQTELRPLYTNLTGTQTVMSALSEASLPATDRNISMVQNMMKEGMAVNKQALLDMVSNLNANPDAHVDTIVQMSKLGIIIDNSSIHQFENYKNFEHQIVGDVVNMSDGLGDVFESILAENDEISAFSKEAMVLSLALSDDYGIGEGGAQTEIPANTSDIEQTLEQIKNSLEYPAKNDIIDNNGPVIENQVGNYSDKEVFEKPDNSSTMDEIINSFEDKTEIPSSSIIEKAESLIKAYLNTPENFSEEAKEELKNVLSDPKFKGIVKDNIINQLTLKPADIKEDGKVEALYKKIIDISSKALDILSDTPHVDNQTMKSAQNLMDNVQFMNQLNEMMTYVQLPLKMSEENAHGDLYVYTNKKKLAENDGNYSALLHLDMEHLGPMDVYVKLQQEKVNTHFYMKDEATLDFIEANIHILNERLSKKGYTMNTNVSIKEDNKSMVDTFLEDKNEGTVAPVLSTVSFDVRA